MSSIVICTSARVLIRFFQTEIPHDLSSRSCNIDYDREIAILAESTEHDTRKMVGVGRVQIAPDDKTGEATLLVPDPWQGMGLGLKLLDYLIEISKEKNLETLTGVITADNRPALDLAERMGFTLHAAENQRVRVELNLQDALAS